MSFRAKCPTCGRRQSLEESDVGHTVWCSACGNRFIVEWSAPETETPQSVIPDIDFPVNFASQAFGSAPVIPSILPAAAPPPPQQQPVPSLETEDLVPEPQAVTAPTFVQPQPIVVAPDKNQLIPILIGLVIAMGIALVCGLFAIVYLLGRPSVQAALPAISSTPVLTTLQQKSSPIISHREDDAIKLQSAVPATLPASPIAADTGHDENPKQTTVSPVIAKIPEATPVRFRPVPAPASGMDLDDQVGRSIDHAVNYLLNQLVDGKLRDIDNQSGPGTGLDALAVYALLQAGEATHDLRLNYDSPVVGKMLGALKLMPVDKATATYTHSLRAAALGVYHRAPDIKALKIDASWLIANSSNGAYGYGASTQSNVPSALRQHIRMSEPWDNSNSQYGALGVWAALEAGAEVPNAYWMSVQKHWLGCQLPDGEWAYTGYGDMGRMSMTVAGITTLLVAQDQLEARSVVSTLGHVPFNPALQHGLNWLESGDNSVKLPEYFRCYALFGLERAALASGFKYFGNHNWYKELATEQMALQQNDGSWVSTNPVAAPIVDTSYTLLFLSRGRHPIFMNKLRFDGYWSNRPRDIANLTHYATTVLERPLNWQVVSLKSDWSDWMDSPVLYIASHEAIKFTDEDCDKLRAYASNGGLIFTHADGDAPAFNKSIAELSKRLFPQYPLTDLPATHPIFSTLYKIKLQPKFQGISNGSRLLLLHSPTDLNKVWQQRDWVERPVDFQMGINIFIYAAGKADLNNKLQTPLVAAVDVKPILTTSIAQLKYHGDFNPEPAGLPRFAQLFAHDTSVKLNVVEAEPAALKVQDMPLVHLTGTSAIPYDTLQLKAIHDYVEQGGILLVDACGASPAFLKSMLLDFFPHAFPGVPMRDMPDDHPILAGTGAGMTPVSLRLRPYRSETDGAKTQPIQYLTLGKGMVIYSTVDLTTGFLGTNTWGINGYQPSIVYDLVRNILLYTLEKN